MHIETDKYLITSDKYNVIAQLKYIVEDSIMLKDKSKIGSVGLGEKNFYPTLEAAYAGILKQMINDSDSKSLDDIKMLIRELINEVSAMRMEMA